MHPDHLVDDLIDDHESDRRVEQKRQLEAQWRAFADHLRWSEDGRQSIGAMLDLDPDEFQASRKNDSVRLLIGRNFHDGGAVAALASTATSGIGYGVRVGSEALGVHAVRTRGQARVLLAAALGMRLVYEPTDTGQPWVGREVLPDATYSTRDAVRVRPIEGDIVHAESFDVEPTELTIHPPVLTTTEESAA